MLYQQTSGVNNMSFFNWWKRKKPSKEEQIQAVKKETFEKVDEASEQLKVLNRILDGDDVTLNIYYATRRRKEHKNG